MEYGSVMNVIAILSNTIIDLNPYTKYKIYENYIRYIILTKPIKLFLTILILW